MIVEDLDRIIEILKDPSLKLPSQEKSRKTLIHLKTLIEIMTQLEESTNRVLRQVLNGHAKASLASLLNGSGASTLPTSIHEIQAAAFVAPLLLAEPSAPDPSRVFEEQTV